MHAIITESIRWNALLYQNSHGFDDNFDLHHITRYITRDYTDLQGDMLELRCIGTSDLYTPQLGPPTHYLTLGALISNEAQSQRTAHMATDCGLYFVHFGYHILRLSHHTAGHLPRRNNHFHAVFTKPCIFSMVNLRYYAKTLTSLK